jgi:folylpolyglutamate synthase/dihydropteroate synthase
VIDALEARGFSVPEAARRDGLLAAAMPGRGEIMPRLANDPEPMVIIDAAHNPDKMRALVASLSDVVEAGAGQRSEPVLLTGALVGKDAGAMLESLLGSVSAVVTTAVGVTGKEPRPATDLADLITTKGFTGPIAAHADVAMALDAAMTMAKDRGVPLLVTGSIFLAGQVREHWFPDRDILRQQTPWPDVPGREV